MSEGTCFMRRGGAIGFVAVPKVMSTSIKAALLGIDAAPRDVHALAEEDRVPIADARRDGVFLFSFVRNPAKRLISTWANRVHQPEGGRSRLTDPEQGLFKAGLSFPDFVTRLEEVGVDAEIHLKPQADFIMPGGRLIVDFVGRFEQRSRDWSILRKTFELPPLPQMNASNAMLGKIDKAMAKRIRALYAKDYALLGYGT